MSGIDDQKKMCLEALPAWIREDLIAETIEVWQPYYEERLTEQEAIGILFAVSHLFSGSENDEGENDDGEAISGVGAGL